jgi:hypothetical protein
MRDSLGQDLAIHTQLSLVDPEHNDRHQLRELKPDHITCTECEAFHHHRTVKIPDQIGRIWAYCLDCKEQWIA